MKTTFMFLSTFDELAIKYDDDTIIEVNTVEELAQIARTFCTDKRVSDALLNGNMSFAQAAKQVCSSMISAGDSNALVLIAKMFIINTEARIIGVIPFCSDLYIHVLGNVFNKRFPEKITRCNMHYRMTAPMAQELKRLVDSREFPLPEIGVKIF